MSGITRIRNNRFDKWFTINLAIHDLPADVLSPEGKTLHTYLASRPDGWEYHRTHAVAMIGSGYKVDKGIKELKSLGLLRVDTARENGKFTGYEWFVATELPADYQSPKSDNQDTAPKCDIPDPVIPDPAIQDTYKRYHSEEKKTSSEKQTARAFENVPLPLDFEDKDPPIDPDVITPAHQNPSHSSAMGASGGAVGFDGFWSIYPRSEGRKAAQKAWGKLKPGEQQQATADVRARVEAGAWREVRFVPHAATYLNNSRWLDDWRKVLQQAKPQGAAAASEKQDLAWQQLMEAIHGS